MGDRTQQVAVVHVVALAAGAAAERHEAQQLAGAAQRHAEHGPRGHEERVSPSPRRERQVGGLVHSRERHRHGVIGARSAQAGASMLIERDLVEAVVRLVAHEDRQPRRREGTPEHVEQPVEHLLA